jgi:hypothetical protein
VIAVAMKKALVAAKVASMKVEEVRKGITEAIAAALTAVVAVVLVYLLQ